MLRREFLKKLLGFPLLLRTALGLAATRTGGARAASKDDLDSFGYYQGLGPTEKRDPRRTDGTYSGMPTILRKDIDAAIDKDYNFWHGHSGKLHKFTITHDQFLALQRAETIEPYTSVVDGHRHSLRVVGT